MKTITLTLAIAFALNTFCFAQTATQKAFLPFANKQSDLMKKAYDQHDADADRILVEEFAARYKLLNADDKVYFKGNLVGAYYNLSCAYALASNKGRSFQYLDSAITNGYTNYKHLQNDTDFAQIKSDPKFKQLGNIIRATGDYLYILQNAGKYDNLQQREIPVFTYQSKNAPELVALRKKFNLDSIAGTGNDAAKMLNLLHWVHNTVSHDGQHESGIKLINANEIIGVARAKKVGVSCGELASVLQDCYLAMGWKARKVYCFPKDSLKTDFDSHVINVVYLPAKNKWIWVDPTNNAYVTDENGEMLSIREVRERLVNNKPLAINTDANWNNRLQVTKKDYLYNYMAKNLYILYSPLKSEYNYQTPGENNKVDYVMLLPLAYYSQTPDKTVTTKKETHTTLTRYRTNNAEQFWSVN